MSLSNKESVSEWENKRNSRNTSDQRAQAVKVTATARCPISQGRKTLVGTLIGLLSKPMYAIVPHRDQPLISTLTLLTSEDQLRK